MKIPGVKVEVARGIKGRKIKRQKKRHTVGIKTLFPQTQWGSACYLLLLVDLCRATQGRHTHEAVLQCLRELALSHNAKQQLP